MSKKKERHWSFYTIELMAVFLGVTAGFLLNTWREENTESELEEKYLTSFYDDIIVDEQNLDSLIIHNNKKSEKLMSILQETSSSKTPVTEQQAQEIVKESLRIEWFSPSNDTYADIKNSGNHNLISDYNLKRKISSYYKFQKEVRKGEQYYLDHMNNYVFPLLYKNYIMYERKFVNKTSYQSLEFSNMYIALLAFINQNINGYNELIVKNRELKNILIEALSIYTNSHT